MWYHQWWKGNITPLHMLPLLLLKDYYILWPSLSQGQIADWSSACFPSGPPGYFLKSYIPVGWPQCLIILHEVIPLRCRTVFISIKLLWFYSHTSYVIQVPSFSIHLWPVSWTEQNRTLPSIIWCVPVLVVGLTPVCSSSILDSDFIIVSNVKQICSPTQGYCLNGLLLFKNQIMCISYKWIY